MDNLIKDEEETCGNRNVVLKKDMKNTLVGTCELVGSFKENGKKKDVYT